MKIFHLCLIILLAISACSNKDVYNQIQSNGKRKCQREPLSRYDECMAQYHQSYEAYKKSRDELLKNSKKKIK